VLSGPKQDVVVRVISSVFGGPTRWKVPTVPFLLNMRLISSANSIRPDADPALSKRLHEETLSHGSSVQHSALLAAK
jgi:hypothetical protein